MHKVFALLLILPFISLLSCQDETVDPSTGLDSLIVDEIDTVIVESDSLEFDLEPDDVLFVFNNRLIEYGWVFLVDNEGHTTEAKACQKGEKITFLAGELPNPYPFAVYICLDHATSSSHHVNSFENLFDPGDEFVFLADNDPEAIGTAWFEFDIEQEISIGRYDYYDFFNLYDEFYSSGEVKVYSESGFSFFCHQYQDSELPYYKDVYNLNSGDTLRLTESDFKAYDGFVDLTGKTGYSIEIIGEKDGVEYWVDQGGTDDIIYYPTGVFDKFQVATNHEHLFWDIHRVVNSDPRLTPVNIDDYQITFNDSSNIIDFSVDAVKFDYIALTHGYISQEGTNITFSSYFEGTNTDLSFTHFPEEIADQFEPAESLYKSEVHSIFLFDNGSDEFEPVIGNSDDYFVLAHYFDKPVESSSGRINLNHSKLFEDIMFSMRKHK